MPYAHIEFVCIYLILSDDRFCVATHGVTSGGSAGDAASLLRNHDKASEER